MAKRVQPLDAATRGVYQRVQPNGKLLRGPLPMVNHPHRNRRKKSSTDWLTVLATDYTRPGRAAGRSLEAVVRWTGTGEEWLCWFRAEMLDTDTAARRGKNCWIV